MFSAGNNDNDHPIQRQQEKIQELQHTLDQLKLPQQRQNLKLPQQRQQLKQLQKELLSLEKQKQPLKQKLTEIKQQLETRPFKQQEKIQKLQQMSLIQKKIIKITEKLIKNTRLILAINQELKKDNNNTFQQPEIYHSSLSPKKTLGNNSSYNDKNVAYVDITSESDFTVTSKRKEKGNRYTTQKTSFSIHHYKSAQNSETLKINYTTTTKNTKTTYAETFRITKNNSLGSKALHDMLCLFYQSVFKNKKTDPHINQKQLIVNESYKQFNLPDFNLRQNPDIYSRLARIAIDLVINPLLLTEVYEKLIQSLSAHNTVSDVHSYFNKKVTENSHDYDHYGSAHFMVFLHFFIERSGNFISAWKNLQRIVHSSKTRYMSIIEYANKLTLCTKRTKSNKHINKKCLVITDSSGTRRHFYGRYSEKHKKAKKAGLIHDKENCHQSGKHQYKPPPPLPVILCPPQIVGSIQATNIIKTKHQIQVQNAFLMAPTLVLRLTIH